MIARMQLCVLFGVLHVAVCGCSSGPASNPTAVRYPGDQYAPAFEAAKDALRERGFELDRVDASAGIITTLPRSSAGLASPWVPQAQTFDAATRQLAHRERRIAVVSFAPVDRPLPIGESDEATRVLPRETLGVMDSAAMSASGLEVRVTVIVERVYRPGWRVDSASVRVRSVSRDPQLESRGMQPTYAVAQDRDEELAGAIVDDLRTRLTPSGE